MLYVGGLPKIVFKTQKTKTKKEFKCCMTKEFCVLLYSDNTCYVDNQMDKVCFVLPIHLPSFIHKYDKKMNLPDSINKFFVFKSKEDKEMFSKYCQDFNDLKIRKIGFLDR
ncbi:hypothetical protein CWI38_0598p0010 [Hamiltosporidium tvaerminnensis]|uniref:Uncharacterized protein n=1 Tax=Hamiltosporidium tvaerminnensis TaxID=1176355 RepID=A0A4Q9LA96_9MICR|nr:hypothetical protein CWI37_0100p0030 [Hamiltosporidium tvaerminnensis]TBU12872.1 hypothetical protein CWI38_0598p0010 [Hamiltosporidium tvaerminnensis]